MDRSYSRDGAYRRVPVPLIPVSASERPANQSLVVAAMATVASPPPPSQDNRVAKTAPARNPISSRLYKVLGTNYNDPALREALEIISDLHSTPDLSGKHTVYNDQEKTPIDSGKTVLSSSGIAARARKSLRRDAELRLTQASRQFLKAFQEVDKVRSEFITLINLSSELFVALRCSANTYR